MFRAIRSRSTRRLRLPEAASAVLCRLLFGGQRPSCPCSARASTVENHCEFSLEHARWHLTLAFYRLSIARNSVFNGQPAVLERTDSEPLDLAGGMRLWILAPSGKDYERSRAMDVTGCPISKRSKCCSRHGVTLLSPSSSAPTRGCTKRDTRRTSCSRTSKSSSQFGRACGSSIPSRKRSPSCSILRRWNKSRRLSPSLRTRSSP